MAVSSRIQFCTPPRTYSSCRCEPYELVEITVPDEYSGAVVDMLNRRKGEMQLMGGAEGSEGWQALSYLIPTRGECLVVWCAVRLLCVFTLRVVVSVVLLVVWWFWSRFICARLKTSFLFPSWLLLVGMIGIRSALLTATKGTVVLDTQFDSYRPHAGVIAQREKGSLLATETGVSNPYGIAGMQDRGRMYISPKDEVYKDMIIGVHQRPGDLHVSVVC